MAEDIVENVRLLQIIKLRLRADEGTSRKPPVGKVIEEYLVRHQFSHRHDSPAGDVLEPVGQFLHLRNTRSREFQRRHRIERRLAGTAFRHVALAAEQSVPPVVFDRRIGGPVLSDSEIGCARYICVTVLWDVFRIQDHRKLQFWLRGPYPKHDYASKSAANEPPGAKKLQMKLILSVVHSAARTTRRSSGTSIAGSGWPESSRGGFG